MKKKAISTTSKTFGKLSAKDFCVLIAEVRNLIQSARLTEEFGRGFSERNIEYMP